MDSLLNVEDLRTEFLTQDGIVHAVNGISFALEPGETLAIVGESGCGKSVTMLSILRLIPQPPGRIAGKGVWFGGQDLLTADEEAVRQVRGNKIGMVFQDPMTSLNPVLTIERQIAETLLAHRAMTRSQARARSVELLEMVEIPGARERIRDYPHQFSGGMRQRVMIAIALACEPKLLIADEPTTALDVTIQAQIVDTVKELRRSLGMSIIWITHDLGVAAGLADRVQVMYAGYIVESAPVDGFYEDTRHPYSLGLLGSLPRLDARTRQKLKPIEGMPPDLINLPVGCPYRDRCQFQVPRCQEENPVLREVGPGHHVACWVDIS